MIEITEHEKLALKKLQEIDIGGKMPISFFAKKNPEYFIEQVKNLIDKGYIEYEFSNDYKFVKRLNMCNFGVLEVREWQK